MKVEQAMVLFGDSMTRKALLNIVIIEKVGRRSREMVPDSLRRRLGGIASVELIQSTRHLDLWRDINTYGIQ